MSPSREDEFKNKNIPDIQNDFFREALADDGGYQYQKSGINTKKDAVILFQFANRILAQARFIKSEKYPEPVDGKYHGILHFDPKSIHIFPAALTVEQIREFWPKVAQFNNAKRFLDPSAYRAFENRYVNNPYASAAADNDLGPAAKIRTVTARYIRDTKKSLAVKLLHGYRCQVVGCRTPSTLPNEVAYAEGHHLKPLGHKGPDDESNILCLCPYHHVAFDMGAIRLKAAKLRRVDGHTVSQEFIDYHNQEILK